LHLAAARGLTNQVARLLAANAPMDVKDTNGLTPLDVAVQAKQTEAVRLLLAKNAPDASSKYGISTPLHEAAASGDINALTNALQTTTNLEAHDELGFTPFQIAVKRGHLLAASLLLEAGANVNARDAKGNTALQIILQEPPPYIFDHPSLRWYARVHQDEQLKYLYPYMVDTGYSSSSALLEATVFLLANKASVSGTNDAGKSVIELVTSDSARILPEDREKLLQLFGRQSISSGHDSLNERDANGDTALHRAARDIYADKVAELIASGADVNATNNLGRTPLHAAVEHLGIWPGPLTELLKAGANPNAQDNEGMTPLHVLLATDSSFRAEAARALLEAGANPNSEDNHGLTPLLTLANSHNDSSAEVLKILLQGGANPNAKDKHGRTALHLFLSGKWPWNSAGECIPLLADAGADFSAADDQGRTPLHYLAALGGQSPMFFIHNIGDVLEKAKVNIRARDDEGNTPLHLAAKYGTKDVFGWLLQHGASLDTTNNAEETPRQLALTSTNQFAPFWFNSDVDIYQAIREEKLESVAAILKSEPDLLNKTNQFGETPLRAAVMSNRTNIVEFLAQRGAKWDEVSATIANRAKILQDILARKPAFVTNISYTGNLLHLAAEHDAVAAAKTLIAAGADLHARDVWGLSPLGDALLRHQTNVANLFFQQGARENIFDAVYLGDFGTTKNLLAQDKSLARATNKNRLTLTEIAAATGHDKILKLLLNDGAPLDSTNGTTPLHAAAIYDQTNAVKLLIQRGANREACDEHGFTPLHLAVIQGSTETVALLLKHGWFKSGADPNARTISPPSGPTRPMPMMSRFGMSAGNTALHFAAMNAQTNIIELLLKSGASVNATNAIGMTPLDFASRGSFGPPISFWIGRDFIFGPPELFRTFHNNPQISPSARKAAIDLLEKAGARHGENFQRNGMPGIMRGGIF
jgi:ankyrin repeat protein